MAALADCFTGRILGKRTNQLRVCCAPSIPLKTLAEICLATTCRQMWGSHTSKQKVQSGQLALRFVLDLAWVA